MKAKSINTKKKMRNKARTPTTRTTACPLCPGPPLRPICPACRSTPPSTTSPPCPVRPTRPVSPLPPSCFSAYWEERLSVLLGRIICFPLGCPLSAVRLLCALFRGLRYGYPLELHLFLRRWRGFPGKLGPHARRYRLSERRGYEEGELRGLDLVSRGAGDPAGGRDVAEQGDLGDVLSHLLVQEPGEYEAFMLLQV